jgi:hypothetical protein
VYVSEKLRDVYDKLDWADKHIADLRKRIGDYFHSSPPAVTGELAFDFDRNTVDWSGIRFKLVDVSIPLTIGDAAGNLRGRLTTSPESSSVKQATIRLKLGPFSRFLRGNDATRLERPRRYA